MIETASEAYPNFQVIANVWSPERFTVSLAPSVKTSPVVAHEAVSAAQVAAVRGRVRAWQILRTWVR